MSGSSTSIEGKILSAKFTNESTVVTFVVNHQPKNTPFQICFNNLFLRDSSRSANSVDPKTGQKMYTTGRLAAKPIHTIPNSMQISPDGMFLNISWKDNDSYDYPLEFFYKYKGCSFMTRSIRKQFSKHRPVIWNARVFNESAIESDFAVKYDDFVKNDAALYDTLIKLQKYGLALITDIPQNGLAGPDMMRTMVCRVGPLRRTTLNAVFEVNNLTEDHSHIGLTNLALPMQTDFQYMENVPGFKFLYCVKNQTHSGESIFVDGYNVARELKEADVQAYEALKAVPINYEYKIPGKCFYYESRPLIEEFDANEQNIESHNFEYLIKHVNYSPSFQAPFTYGIYNKLRSDSGREASLFSNETSLENCQHTNPGKVVERYAFRKFVRGLTLFEDMVNDPVNQFKLKIPENSCILINNRRILQGRTLVDADDKTKQRLMYGCYLDTDNFRSRLKAFEESDMA